MTDLLIVGNGFDLYHGLPTRYTDFLKFISYWSMFWDNYNGGDCISYIRFTGKGCKETGRITDYFRGDRDGTTII